MGEPNQEELDQLQGQIDDVRRYAEEHGTVPDREPKPTLADPDGDGEVEPYEAPTGG